LRRHPATRTQLEDFRCELTLSQERSSPTTSLPTTPRNAGSSPNFYNGYWFVGRPTLEELRQDLRAVTKKCRPDWDITAPELKAAWQQGRKELFYPYGKTYVQTLGEQD
jgi:hypothetical protein